MKISEIITDKYKLRIPPTVYYDLLADVQEAEEEQEPTTKNNLGVDCISRAEAIKCLECDFDITGKENMKTVVNYINSAHDKIVNLPSVTPQEPQTFKWCTDCKEYDQEKHCCPRWSKVIRDTVEEMKQEYIEREVIDKLRAEITTLQNRCYALTKGTMCAFCKYECKYKAETEAE